MYIMDNRQEKIRLLALDLDGTLFNTEGKITQMCIRDRDSFVATTKRIQSLERAAMILELFQNQVTELGLKEIVEKTELNKSTAFGLVNMSLIHI